jgi:RHS repeat-associated protein
VLASTSWDINATACGTVSTCVSVGGIVDANGGYADETTDGTHWSVATLPSTTGSLDSVSCWSSSQCVAVGFTTTSDPAIIVTTDGGAVWTATTVPSAIYEVQSVSCALGSGGVCWATGSGSLGLSVLTSSAGGSVWSVANETSQTYEFDGISCATTSSCVVVGGGYSGTNNSGSWVFTPGYEGAPWGPSISCVTVSFCVGGDQATNGSDMWSTANSGSSWTPLNSIAATDSYIDAAYHNACEQYFCSPDISSISCPSASVCVATGQVQWSPDGCYGGCFYLENFSIYSSDGGLTWTAWAPYPPSDLACPSTSTCLDGYDDSSIPAIPFPTSGPLGGVPPAAATGSGSNQLEKHVSGCGCADPVNVEDGDFYESSTDGVAPTSAGPPLDFTRTYDADMASSELASSTPGPLGYGWTDNFSTSLLLNDPSSTDVTVVTESGAESVFSPPPGGACVYPQQIPTMGGSYCALPQVAGSLTLSGSTYTLKLANDTIETFTTSGSTAKLSTITDAEGNVTTVSNGLYAPGTGECPSTSTLNPTLSCETLYMTTGTGGQQLTLGWSLASEAGLITSVTTSTVNPSQNRWLYDYCTATSATCAVNDLVSVADPLGDLTQYTYDGEHTNDLLTLQPPTTSGSIPSGQPATFCANPKQANAPVGFEVNCYNGADQVVAQANPDGATTLFSYAEMNDAFGDGVVAMTAPDGVVSDFSYLAGELQTTTDAPNGAGTALSFNGSGWTVPAPVVGANTLESVSCPTSAFCVAVDASGKAVIYNGSSWSVPTTIDGTNALTGVSCPTVAFCEAVDAAGNSITYNGSSWGAPQAFDENGAPTGISCVSSTFCEAVDAAGYADTYTGTGGWGSGSVADASSPLAGVSCASSTFCEAVDGAGYAVTYNGTSWATPQDADEHYQLTAVSCTSSSFCAAVDASGDLGWYNGTSWVFTTVDASHGLTGISCTSSTFCEAVDTAGNVVTYNGSSWPVTKIDGKNALNGVSCATAMFCMALDGSAPSSAKFIYDPATLGTTAATDPDGNVAYGSYDGSGNTLVSTDGVGNTSLNAYNASNEILCSIEPAEYLVVGCPSPEPSAPPAAGTTDPNLGLTLSIYNAANELTAVTDPLGNTTTYSYTASASGLPVGLQYCSVDAVEYQKGVVCPTAYSTAHTADTTSATFDSTGDETTSTDADGDVTTYGYTNGLLTSETDPDGTTTTYHVNVLDQTTSTVVTSGSYTATTLFAYDGDGHLFCEVAPLEAALGKLCPSSPPTPPTPSSDAWKGATITSYDAAGLVTQVTNPLGGITYDAYDTAGQMYCSVGPLESAKGVTCPASPPSSPPTIGSDPDAGATITSYDADGRPVQVTNPLGGITITSYDPAGNVASTTVQSRSASGVTAPNVVTENTYDADNRVTASTTGYGSPAPLATTLSYYDPDGNIYCSVSPKVSAGVSGSYQCPAWESAWIHSVPSPTSLYSSTPTSDQANNVTMSFFNADGEQVQTTNPDVETSVFDYDGDGSQTCSLDPVNFATWITSNPSGTYPYLCPSTPLASAPAQGSDPGYLTTIYDPAGRTTSATDQIGDTTSYTYDPAGNTLTTVDPRGKTTTDCYYWQSAAGECAASAPGSGGSGDDLYSVTTPATTADPSGQTTTSTYYPGGSLHTATTPAGGTTDSYDGLGDLVTESYSGTASGYSTPASPSYAYYTDGSRETMTDGTGTTAYSYDAGGDLLSQQFTAASGTGMSSNTTSYSYYSMGQLASVVYPSYGTYTNPTASYTYDAFGNMASVTDWLGTGVSFSHDPDGNETGQTNAVSGANPAGTSGTVFAYDDADEPTSAVTSCSSGTGTVTQSFSGSSGSTNADGQVTEDSEAYAGSCTGTSYERNYSYDIAGRVVYQGSVTQATGTPNNFSYDPSGDLTEISSHSGTNFDTYSQTFDSAGEALTQAPVAGSGGTSSSSTYDSIGDLATTASGSSSSTYSYNQLGEMTSAAATASNKTAYQYTGDGLEAALSDPVLGWSPTTDIDGTKVLGAVSCLSSATCVAVDHSGNAEIYNGATWAAPTDVDGSKVLDAISCSNGMSCAAVDQSGNVVVFKSSSWLAAKDIDGSHVLQGISCPSMTRCAAVDSSGDVVTGNPTSGSWNAAASIDSTSLTGISCPTTTLCAAVDTAGKVITGNPTTSVWNTAVSIDSGSLAAISCSSTTFCAAVDTSGHVVTGNPTTNTWAAAQSIDGTTSIVAVNCSLATFCVAVDVNGKELTYNGTTWSSALSIDTTALTSVSCANKSLCVATDNKGNFLTYNASSVSTQLTWDTASSLALVMSDGTNDYIYGPSGEPVEQVNVTSTPPANNPEFMTYVPSDSSWLITNASGQLVSFYRYDAFGTLATAGTPASPFGYAGQYTDTSANSSGFDNMRARWYDPQDGGFTTRDPDFSDTDQGYAYAGGDPVNGSDPSGMCPGQWYCPSDLLHNVETNLAIGEDYTAGVGNGMLKVVDGIPRSACQSAAFFGLQLASILFNPCASIPDLDLGLGIPVYCPGGITGDVEAGAYALGTGIGFISPALIGAGVGSGLAAEGGAFTADDLGTVREYLSSQGFLDDPANNAMVDRIQSAIDSGRPLTEGEQNFMTHELTEANLVNDGMSQEAAHEIASGTHPPFSNYDPAVISQYPDLFNENWFHYWEGR